VESAGGAREILVERLERANYPVSAVDTIEGEDEVDVVATLVATSVIPEELDAVTTQLEKAPGVTHATWEMHAKS
jgi:putative Mg2+ transporter-C (MgtC) family protein